jgi:hypothetical protein
MTGWEAALWGVLGGAFAEALTLAALMRPSDAKRKWQLPWTHKRQRRLVIAAVGLRLFAGGVLSGALGASAQLSTPVTALWVGVSAPLVLVRAVQAAGAGRSTTAQDSPQGSEETDEERSDAAR